MIKQIQELEDSLKSEDDMVTMARSQEDCKTRMTVPLTDSELRILKLNPISGDLAPGLRFGAFSLRQGKVKLASCQVQGDWRPLQE